ncbi:MAG: pantoate--beta-alanine ligase, partial [Steroidobacteraceae bacterium]
MQFVARPSELRALVAAWRRGGQRVAFVPTMGNLHAGHGSLVGRAAELADRVIVSIFVNPLQFGPNEDFAAYPRTPDDDRRVLESLNVDLLFAPEVADIYP